MSVSGKRKLFINIRFSQDGLYSGCQWRAQGGKDRVEEGACVNDFKPLGELRADPVPMKSFSIVSLYKMFDCKPRGKLGWFCARLLLSGQCKMAALHIENKELQIHFSLLCESRLNDHCCDFLQQFSKKPLCPGRCVSHTLEKENLDSLCTEGESYFYHWKGDLPQNISA